MSVSQDKRGEAPAVIGHVRQIKEIWEIVSWMVSVGSTIGAFIGSVGGPFQFLVEVGFYGIACYVAVWLILPLMLGAIAGLEKLSGRVTTDMAAGIMIGVAVLGGGALLRWGVFAPGLTEDLDAIGTAFGALLGVAVLLLPLVILWYVRGSKPRPPQ